MMWLGRLVGIAVLLVLIVDLGNGSELSKTTRILVMGIAALTYLAIFVKQCQIAYRYEGAPLVWPPAFRWVVAQWFGVTGLLLVWVLVVAVAPTVYHAMVSSIVWGAFAQSTLYFFARWLSVGQPQIAGPGETGAGPS